MMRILLIEPAFYTEKNKLYKIQKRGARYLALTLPYLAALTPNEMEIDLAYEACEDLDNDYDLKAYDLIGITSQTINLKRTLEIARKITKLGRPVVVGGPVTIEDNHRLIPILRRFCTAVVVGEAEAVWPKFLADLNAGSPEKIYQSKQWGPLVDLPLPRFDLVNFDNIVEPYVLPCMTARGCPRACTFCSEFLYSPWRTRPIDDVIAELTAYKTQFGISRVAFRDDNFLASPKRSQELLEKMLPLNLEWGCQTDLSLAHYPNLLELAVRAGMRSVSFGMESVVEENRGNVRKNFFSTVQAEEALQFLYEHGVEVQINVIFGLDHDTPDIFDKTVDFLVRNHVSRFFPSILFPIPGTPIYKELQAENRLLDLHPPGIEDPLYVGYSPKKMTKQELVEGYLYAQERFKKERVAPVYWLGEDKHIWTESNDIS